MKRTAFVLLCLLGLLASPALAQRAVNQPNARPAGQNQPQRPLTPEQQQQNRIVSSIANFYISEFRKEVQLTDDQFIRINSFIQQFINMRFRAAMARENLSQRIEQLRSQPSPSVDDIAALTIEKATVDGTYAKLEPDFLGKIRADIRGNQVLLVLAFNEKFFEKQLPNLLQQARAVAAQRGQNPARPNLNNPRNQIPTEAFREPIR